MDIIDQDQHKTLRMTVLTTPDMTNFYGHVHGGAMLKLLDEVAFACASRYAHHYVVTLSVDQVVFREPMHVGELVTFLASVNYTGNTSLEVGIRTIAENILVKTSRHVMTCYFTMVALDENNCPTSVPPLTVTTADERRRYEAAALRRGFRKEVERRSLEIRRAPNPPEPE